MTAFDTTNLRLAITVPAHGMVRFRLRAALVGATTCPVVLLGVMNGATVVGRVQPASTPVTAPAATQVFVLDGEFTATGLAPGAMNVDAAYAVQVVVASTNIKYGGPNTNAGANAWGAFVFEAWDPQPQTVATQLLVDANGRVDVIKVAGTTQTAGDLKASIVTLQADTDDIQTRLPAALVSGRMDSSVGAMAANVLTATAINADAITAAKVADGTIDAATFAAGAINAAAIAADAITDAKVASDVTIASVTGAVGSVTGAVGSVTGAVGSVTGAVGSVTAAVSVTGDFTATMKTSIGTAVAASAVASVTGNVGGNLVGSVGSLATQAKADVNAEADTALADVGVTGTVTGRIDAAVSTRSTYAGADTAGTTTLLSRLTSGRATLLDNLDAAVSTRLSSAGYTAPNNAGIAAIAGYVDTEVAAVKDVVDAIKAKTDGLNFTVAGKLDVNVLIVNGTTIAGAGTTGSPWGPA